VHGKLEFHSLLSREVAFETIRGLLRLEKGQEKEDSKEKRERILELEGDFEVVEEAEEKSAAEENTEDVYFMRKMSIDTVSYKDRDFVNPITV
jgi:hypothetical protein